MKLNLKNDSIKRCFYAAVSIVLVAVLVFTAVTSIPVNVLAFGMTDGIPMDGPLDPSVHSDARFELVLDGTDVKLYARDCIGLTSIDMVFSYDSSVITAVRAVNGEDAKFINNNIEGNSYTFEYNSNEAGKILYGAYFKEHLWSSEEFAAADMSGECDIDSENFHLTTFKLTLAEGKTASDIEMNFTATANFLDAYGVNCPCIGIEKGGNVPSEEETTTTPDVPSVGSARFELVLDGTDVKLYARDCIGLSNADLVFACDSSVITAVHAVNGEDVNFVNNYIEGNMIITAWNTTDVAEEFHGALAFLDYLWSSEQFAAADSSGECDIDSKNFHLATFKLTLAEGKTASDIEMSFTATANFLDAYGVNCPCIGIKKSGNVPPEEETTAHTHEYSLASTAAASCTADGEKIYKCVCGDSYKVTIPSLGGHKLTWTETKAATSFAEGETTGKCANCDYSEKKAIEKLPEIAVKPEVSDKIKISEKEEVLAIAGDNVEELLKNVPENTEILDANGNEVKTDAPIATGMQVVLKDKDGKVVDTQTIVVLCDVDCDGKVSATDARKTLRASVNLETLKDYQIAAADVEQDNKPKATDARKILRTSVQLENVKELFAKIK